MKSFIPLDAVAVPCRTSPDSWFPESGDNHAGVQLAKHLCRTRCPIRDAFAEWGIRHEGIGIYGGLSAGERQRIRKQRGIVLQTPHMGVAYPHRQEALEHGTEGGYKRHQRRQERPCRSCTQAQTLARAERAEQAEKRRAAS